MLTDTEKQSGSEMSGAPEPSSRRPRVRLFVGWISALFCGLLAFLNASIAQTDGFRIFFVGIGVLLVAGVGLAIVRWCWNHGRSKD